MKHLCSVNVRAVPKHLRDQFKAYAARRNYTMQAAVQELMRQAVANNTKLPRLEAKNGTD
jgi:plasmid stability protein